MADALCGPSNALQNFQKHSSADRTLQQDRLVNRSSPSQGFRSASNANAGLLDPEFDAFQAGLPAPPPPDFQHAPHFPHHLPLGPPPQQVHPAPQAPGWAADFQRLSLSSTTSPVQGQFRAQAAPAAPVSWHQDFLQQQTSVPQQQAHSQSLALGRTPVYGLSGFANPALHAPYGAGMVNHMSDVAQGKQRVQETVPQFDEAAFEQAFKNAQAEFLEVEREATIAESVSEEPQSYIQRIVEMRDAFNRGDMAAAESQLKVLEERGSGALADEYLTARQFTNELRDLVKTDSITLNERQRAVQVRAEKFLMELNQRLMSKHPLFDEHQREIAEHNGPEERLRQEPRQELPRQNDEDEMAETAGRLLERVADNTSEKFQKSQFFELMRRLRDREVRVEGDKMVDVSAPNPTDPSAEPQAQA